MKNTNGNEQHRHGKRQRMRQPPPAPAPADPGPKPDDSLVDSTVTLGIGFDEKFSPMIEIVVQSPSETLGPLTMPAYAARGMALDILAACEAAINEGLILRFLREEVKADEQMTGSIIYAFRHYRARELGIAVKGHDEFNHAMESNDHDTGS